MPDEQIPPAAPTEQEKQRAARSDAELERRFRYHRPTAENIPKHDWVTETTLQLAKDMVAKLPPGRNLSIVLTLLEDVRMRANAAIACGG